MIKITLPDGAVKEYEPGSSALDVAKSISEGLARKVLVASINGEVCLGGIVGDGAAQRAVQQRQVEPVSRDRADAGRRGLVAAVLEHAAHHRRSALRRRTALRGRGLRRHA